MSSEWAAIGSWVWALGVNTVSTCSEPSVGLRVQWGGTGRVDVIEDLLCASL